MKCLYCHEVIDPLGKFCPKCGLPLSEEITLQGASAPGLGGASPWFSGYKPLIALIAASALGAFIGVSAGWLGSRIGAQPEAQAQARIGGPIESTGPAPAGSPQASGASQTGVSTTGVSTTAVSTTAVSTSGSVPAPTTTAAAATASVASLPGDEAPAPATETAAAPELPLPTTELPKPAAPAGFSPHRYDGVWAADKPKQRFMKPSYVPPRDPVPPPTPLAMNPFKEHGPQYVMMYWLTPGADLYGNEGPGPAEKTSQDSQYFLEQY